jgi:carbon monoxide dehydrogenase subunit G
MHYEGAIEAPVPKEKFYSLITDPRSIIGILPDVVGSSIADNDHFEVKAKTGVGYMKGTMDIGFEVLERIEGRKVKLAGHGQGMQSSLEMTLEISVDDAPSGCRANWAADVAIGGLLASVGGRLIDGVAAKYMQQITERLRARVSE